jgi:Family of unknown function (DUF6335)
LAENEDNNPTVVPLPASESQAEHDRIRKSNDRDIVRTHGPKHEWSPGMAKGENDVPTPPSALDLDRTASASRTGRERLHDSMRQHTDTGPALAGGDVDADWASASAVGDEVPGGDNLTPDQNIVEEMGRAVGLEYQHNEELYGDEKVAERDRRRWELDPASSEDYQDR